MFCTQSFECLIVLNIRFFEVGDFTVLTFFTWNLDFVKRLQFHIPCLEFSLLKYCINFKFDFKCRFNLHYPFFLG